MGSGSQTNKTEIPAWLEVPARENIAMGNEVAGLGYVPYYGADVAAFNPMQQAAFQNTGQAANAFGMAGGGLTGMEGMPQPQQFAGGVSGYSSAPMFTETMAALEANNPGQFAAIQNMFINPQSGEGGYQARVAEQQAAQAAMQMGRGYNYDDPNQAANDRALGFGGFQGPNPNGAVGYGAGGYTSLGDMIDGGGPGVHGGKYGGGGAISALGNVFSGNY
tara:strand:+ start:3639 stop:4298 length:660 start_codon:yes stop_codon:yes gene_type:complete